MSTYFSNFLSATQPGGAGSGECLVWHDKQQGRISSDLHLSRRDAVSRWK